MPHRTLKRGLIALAIIFIAGSAVAQSEKPKTHRHHAPQTDQRGTKDHPVAVDIVSTEKSDADTQKEQEESDRKIANDKWTFIIGVVQCVIFFLQLLAFGCQSLWMYFTVKEMKIGTKAAVDAAKAANTTAGWTRDLVASSYQSAHAATVSADATIKSANAMVAIDTAYVFVNEKAFFCSHANGVMIPGLARVKINFINYGKTPATIKEIYKKMLIIEKIPVVPDYKIGIATFDEFVLKYDGASDNFLCTINVSDEECIAIKNCDKAIFFYGFILYEDVFGKEWVRGFGYSYEPLLGRLGKNGGNAYNYYGRYNPDYRRDD